MACSCYSNPCSCSYQAIPCPSCTDPGMSVTAKFFAGYDSQFCTTRLQNAGVNGGVAWGSPNGVTISNTPLVKLGQLEIGEGEPFGNLMVCRANGLWQQVVFTGGTDGVLKVDGNGNVTAVDISTSFAVPDPLTLTTINVTNLNVTTPVVSGTPTFSGLNDDTIVSNIGLNASNQLVKGSSPTISVASFYESNDLAGSSRPNFTFPATPTSAVQVGVEIADPDGIAHGVGLTVVQIDKAGDYLISWRGNYVGHNPAVSGIGNTYNPGLWLKINSVTRDNGNVQVYQDRHVGGWVGGEYLALGMSVGDQISLVGNGSMRGAGEDGNGTGLLGVGIILTKFN